MPRAWGTVSSRPKIGGTEVRQNRAILARAGITKRVTVHGLRRTFNNLSRQIAGNIVTRAITAHVTEEMTEHLGDSAEKAVESGLPSP